MFREVTIVMRDEEGENCNAGVVTVGNGVHTWRGAFLLGVFYGE